MVDSAKGKKRVVGVRFFDTSNEAVAFATLIRKKYSVFAVARTLNESFTSGGYVGGSQERYLVFVDAERLEQITPEVEKISRLLEDRKKRSSYYVK